MEFLLHLHMYLVIPLITILRDIFIKYSKIRAEKLSFIHYTLSGNKSMRYMLKSADGTVASLKSKKIRRNVITTACDNICSMLVKYIFPD